VEFIKSELFDLLKILLPGFITAAIFYGVTSFPKRSEFEAIVTALIFTTIIQALLVPVKALCFLVGTFCSFGQWSADCELVWLVVLAIIIGVAFSYLINNDLIFTLLRKFNVTNQTSYPSEWYSVFSNGGKSKYVVLHLKDERRLHGFPREWPSNPKDGHFVISDPMWLSEDDKGHNIYISLDSDLYMVIDAVNVEFVEIMEYSEWEVPDGKQDAARTAPARRRKYSSKRSKSAAKQRAAKRRKNLGPASSAAAEEKVE
jgi:hypothetical protein